MISNAHENRPGGLMELVLRSIAAILLIVVLGVTMAVFGLIVGSFGASIYLTFRFLVNS